MGQIESAVMAVLGSSGELQARDVHTAVEALLGERVSSSSVKNCLAKGVRTQVERVAWGRYRLSGARE
jgi:predicted transcriptional regulator